MGRLNTLSDRDLDRIFAGDPFPHDRDAEHLASFVRAARGHTLIRPSIEALHLTAVAEAARPLARTPGRPSAPRRRAAARRVLVPAAVLTSLVAKMAVATAAALTAVGGLTVAGILSEEPETPAVETEDGEEARGFFPAPLDEEHTAAANASDTAKEVLAVIDGWMTSGYARGCEFGHAVATAAGGQPGGACPEGQGRGAEGKANAAEKSAAGKAKGADASSAGKAKAAEKSAAGKANAAEKSAAGKANAPTAPSGGGGASSAGGGGSGGAGGGGGTGAPPAPGKP